MSCRNRDQDRGQGSEGSLWGITMRNQKSQASRFVAVTKCRWRRGVSLVSVLIVGLTWMLSAIQVARGSEFRFVVEDLPDHSAAWFPSEVVIHTETDLRDGLIFLLVNPTARTHVFMVEGLYEQVAGEQGDVVNKPLRVTVAPEDSARTLVSLAPWEGSRERGGVEEFRFFCPLHRGDIDTGGTIRMVHHGGTIRTVQ